MAVEIQLPQVEGVQPQSDPVPVFLTVLGRGLCRVGVVPCGPIELFLNVIQGKLGGVCVGTEDLPRGSGVLQACAVTGKPVRLDAGEGGW